MPFVSVFSEEYGSFANLADFFRQVGADERTHKEESLQAMELARLHRIPPVAAAEAASASAGVAHIDDVAAVG